MHQDRKPMINPCTYSHLIYEKTERIYNGERQVYSISGADKTRTTMYKRINLEHSLKTIPQNKEMNCCSLNKARHYKTLKGNI